VGELLFSPCGSWPCVWRGAGQRKLRGVFVSGRSCGSVCVCGVACGEVEEWHHTRYNSVKLPGKLIRKYITNTQLNNTRSYGATTCGCCILSNQIASTYSSNAASTTHPLQFYGLAAFGTEWFGLFFYQVLIVGETPIRVLITFVWVLGIEERSLFVA